MGPKNFFIHEFMKWKLLSFEYVRDQSVLADFSRAHIKLVYYLFLLVKKAPSKQGTTGLKINLSLGFSLMTGFFSSSEQHKIKK